MQILTVFPPILCIFFHQRPLSTQNCWTDACGVHWRVSLWTLCTATCGNYGFQSRRVECVRVHTNQPVQDHLCAWRPRPANWQRCNITPCENSTFLLFHTLVNRQCSRLNRPILRSYSHIPPYKYRRSSHNKRNWDQRLHHLTT